MEKVTTITLSISDLKKAAEQYVRNEGLTSTVREVELSPDKLGGIHCVVICEKTSSESDPEVPADAS